MGTKKLTVVGLAALSYVGFLAMLDWGQFVQFTLNSFVAAAIYGLIAMGFTLVFSAVWFFDLAYGVVPAVGAYMVFSFHLTRGAEPNPLYAGGVGVIVAITIAWILFTWLYPALRRKIPSPWLVLAGGAVAAAGGGYVGFLLLNPDELQRLGSPVLGALVVAGIGWVTYKIAHRKIPVIRGDAWAWGLALVTLLVAVVAGMYSGALLSDAPHGKLIVSAAFGIGFAGILGLALYRGLYFYLRRRARSPLTMIVSSLGVMLALQAVISLIFTVQPQVLPRPPGSATILLAGGYIKPFQMFNIGVCIVVLLSLLLMLKTTAFGKAFRAIGDDEEVARIVGVNTPVVIAGVFFLGATIAAIAGILMGLDLGTIQPRMGFLPLFKGWIAAVIGGVGRIDGAVLGGVLLAMVENYGVWFISAEWKDAIAFVVLILVLIFMPRGLLAK